MAYGLCCGRKLGVGGPGADKLVLWSVSVQGFQPRDHFGTELLSFLAWSDNSSVHGAHTYFAPWLRRRIFDDRDSLGKPFRGPEMPLIGGSERDFTSALQAVDSELAKNTASWHAAAQHDKAL